MVRIYLEAGPLSQWLYEGLAEAGLPVVCAETRQLKAVLSATVNKSDRNDAHGIAQMTSGFVQPLWGQGTLPPIGSQDLQPLPPEILPPRATAAKL